MRGRWPTLAQGATRQATCGFRLNYVREPIAHVFEILFEVLLQGRSERDRGACLSRFFLYRRVSAGREKSYLAVTAHGAGKPSLTLLPVELLPGLEPALEDMFPGALEVVNDHRFSFLY